MDRTEAVILLKDLFGACMLLEGKSVMLMPPTADNVLSSGYQVHIKIASDEATRICIDSIIRKYKLAVKEDKDRVIIYRPLAEK